MFRFFFLLIIMLPSFSYAQNDDHHNHHAEHKHEIGLAVKLVYLPSEKEIAPASHIEYVYMFHSIKLGFGIIYERLFDEHGHNGLGILVTCPVYRQLNIALSPSIVFVDEEPFKYKGALHFEVFYTFNIKNFHIGPAIGLSLEKEGIHTGTGLHLGIGF